MDVDAPLTLLGGLSPARFMRLHWQRKPLLVRQAWPGVAPPVARAALFDLAARDDVEARLVEREGERWRVRQGPLPRRALPPVSRAAWTLLVQGLDLHLEAAHAMLAPFRFIPDARLDDLMVSWASPGGGVGPHLDAYDVFLIQVQGRRRWRVGRVADPSWVEGAPLKLLQRFEPSFDWVLEPGDLLYLPPLWGHDGVAEGGDCMTCSVGFRVPARVELARELLLRLADELDVGDRSRLYRDPQQPATTEPARVPPALLGFARAALRHALDDPGALERALGSILSEPKAQVWFEGARVAGGDALCLDRRTRMVYDERHLYINGEALRAGGRDATLMRRLADRRALTAADCRRLSAEAAAALAGWVDAGWAHRVGAVSAPGHSPARTPGRVARRPVP
ncbi:MAG: cupin domain-containing protein [Burkholderiales bacterium]|nr:cupin domain-containing protein [Burkholderiales bacterium]MDE1925969.1 cupin domain-containing protein [Burkholderiales bacterium]MDE2159694.1 cupin domain-containing protein [Burkholderiales bacterium]MDE2505243.1 cupin domain-containing protein [Burkholderiales bacterium]